MRASHAHELPALPGQVDPDPGLALGRGLPNVPWTVRQRDRIYNMLIAGGQGSGKSSMLMRVAMNDIEASNTATIVLDMKGSLSERLLRLTGSLGPQQGAGLSQRPAPRTLLP